MFAVKPQTSSWTSAHAQGYFSATILEYLAFEGFALSPASVSDMKSHGEVSPSNHIPL
jgi:hypothetical protein